MKTEVQNRLQLPEEVKPGIRFWATRFDECGREPAEWLGSLRHRICSSGGRLPTVTIESQCSI